MQKQLPRNTYRDVDIFFSKMLERPECIYTEIDSTLANTRGEGYLYYPECIWNLINTEPVKRMARIFQLGTKIYTVDNVNHTRLEHSKGCYYRTLELLQNLYSDERVQKMIDEKGYQKYMLAELVRALLHDVGHGPFSHTMETVCNLPKGFHEDIGLRMIKEEPELREALEEIYPGFPEIYEKTINKNFLGLNRIFEGQVDLDRGDFLPRDSFYSDRNFAMNSIIVAELFNNVTLEKLRDKDGRTRLIPVFDASQIDNLDNFFINRFNNYRDLYYCTEGSSYDYIFKAFAERLMQSSEDYALKTFLAHNIGRKPEEIDLQEYIKYNDVEYLKGIMEVAEKTDDEILRKLAIMSLPPREKFQDFYYGLMVSAEQVDDKGNREYTTESDEDFIQKLMQYEQSRRTYEQNCITLKSRKQEDVRSMVEDLKDLLQVQDQDLERLGIMSWTSHIVSYKRKPGEEAYVKSKDGEIYEYSEHPERKAPILETDVAGFCLLTPLLEANGYTQEQIEQAKECVNKHNIELEAQDHNDH